MSRDESRWLTNFVGFTVALLAVASVLGRIGADMILSVLIGVLIGDYICTHWHSEKHGDGGEK